MPASNSPESARHAQSANHSGDRALGQVYAKALLGAAEKRGEMDQAVAALEAIVCEVLDPHPEFEQVLDSRIISPDDKAQLLDRVFAGQVSPLILDFLKVVGRRGRLGALRTIARAASDLHDEMLGRTRVEVRTAARLDEGLRQRLHERLRGVLGSEPVLGERVEPELIGGLIVRVGDKVLDGSVATQLEQLRTQIINRSVHEIQSRRDRFRHPGGN